MSNTRVKKRPGGDGIKRPGKDGIVIAGGGLAAQRCAETLRREGYTGPIRMLCGEAHLPYDRPPLSKGVLSSAEPGGELAYRSAEWYPANEVDVIVGARAASLEPAGRRIELSDGTRLRYEKLLIATGGRPRSLPLLSGYDNVSVLRTVDDAVALRDVLATRPHLVIVGAGFIGLEVAASARRMGTPVTLIEADSCPLRGVLGPELGRWFMTLHESEGVNVRTSVTIERVHGRGRAQALRLSDGTRVEAGHILVGVGIAPEVEWLAGTGLATTAGVLADRCGRTAAPDVFAAGDAAATLDEATGRHRPGSHWEAAARQAISAARLMHGAATPPPSPSSFWSDQYGLRIQYVGSRTAQDAVSLDGDPETRSFTAWFHRGSDVVAAVLVNRARELPAARMAIERRAR